MVLEATPISEPADAAAMNCLLVKLFLAIFKILSFGVISKHDIKLKISL